MNRVNTFALGALLAALLCTTHEAHADVDGVITFDGVWVASTRSDTLADSRGLGATMRVLGSSEPFNLQVGAFAAIGQPGSGDVGQPAGQDNRLRRDIYDVHVSFGLNPPTKKRRLLVPFASIGVDFVYVNTRAPGGESAAGVTMGLDVSGGVFGHLSENWMYSASATYIGAVVPGTGDGLDGLVFQLGVGKRLFD